jgi:hypothetical protein
MKIETPQENTLNVSLKHFETAEANLVKVEKLWEEIRTLTPNGVSFGSDIEYEEKCRLYEMILPHLTKINGWSPGAIPMGLNDIAQARFEIQDLLFGDIGAVVTLDNQIDSPGTELRQYRFLLNQTRKELVRSTLIELIDKTDSIINQTSSEIEDCKQKDKPASISPENWEQLSEYINQIDILLGSMPRPERWGDLNRHIFFRELGDFNDIEKFDWPKVKSILTKTIYDENEPIPSQVEDLSILLSKKLKNSVVSQLTWKNIDAGEFERVIYNLIVSSEGYENPQWLTQTNAPDKGRDLSVDRIIKDSLGGVIRQRVIIQCKHWQAKSLSITDIATLQAQMKLWEPPRVDVHIIATTGRFTTDTIGFIEKENQSDKAMRVEMWPDSHLENLLAKRPDIIAQFNLR